MSSTIFVAPTANFVQTTLNGAITNSATSITLNSVTNLQAPGYVVIDRTDSNGVSTPNAREVVYFTGVSGSQITGCVRGADGSTALTHSDGAVVETIPTVGMWNSLATIVASGFDGNGLLNAIQSTVSIAGVQSTGVYASQASIGVGNIGELRTYTRLYASGASIVGFPMSFVFRTSGSYSGATTFVGGLLVAPRNGTLQWVSIITRFAASAASVGFDIQKNGSSIFSNATSRPAIAAGGTFVSTASIGTPNFIAGDRFTFSVDSVGASGLITDVTGQGGTI